MTSWIKENLIQTSLDVWKHSERPEQVLFAVLRMIYFENTY